MIPTFLALVLLCSPNVVADTTDLTNTSIGYHWKHPSNGKLADCTITIRNESKTHLLSVLKTKRPRLIKFQTNFYPHRHINATSDLLRPGTWLWTYTTSTDFIPYLSWGHDYGLLSFGLLDTRTLNERLFVQLELPSECPVTYGDVKTTTNIVDALSNLTTFYFLKNYFCFMAEVPHARETVAYTAALYFNYPMDYMAYRCCMTYLRIVEKKNNVTCYRKPISRGLEFTLGPYILGLIIFLYFPIWLFNIAEWVSSDENVEDNEHVYNTNELEQNKEDFLNGTNDENVNVDDWVFLDGNPPYTFFDLFSWNWCGLKRRHPVFISRFRRLLCVLLSPCIVYIYVLTYYLNDMRELINELIDHKAPLGFLSLVGDRVNRSDSFAPFLGGPVALLLAHQLFGFVFIVLPRSLKQIIENGMPAYSGQLSPLFLSATQIVHLSKLRTKRQTGYKKGAMLCICGVHLIISDRFWKRVVDIQVGRVKAITFSEYVIPNVLLKVFFLPFYILPCFIEILLCLIVYGLPFFTFVSITVRGLSTSLKTARMHLFNRLLASYPGLNRLIFNGLTMCLVTVCVSTSVVYYAYASCLIFIEGFVFIAELFVFNFAAVLLFPDVAFGDIFFFAVLIIYLVSLVRSFGNVYSKLLSMAIAVSHDLNKKPSVTVHDGQLVISDVYENLKYLIINDRIVPCSEEALESACGKNIRKKVCLHDDRYGIPKQLFDYLIRNYRPPNQYAIQVVFKFVFVCAITALTISYMKMYLTGPATGISKVMHMVFVVLVGAATPRLLEIALTDVKASIEQEAELRRVKNIIVKFYEENGQ